MIILYQNPDYSQEIQQWVSDGFTRTKEEQQDYDLTKSKILQWMSLEQYAECYLKGFTVNQFPYDIKYKHMTYWGGTDETC